MLDHPYEAASSMHYPGTLFGHDVMTYKDGSPIVTGTHMTTTDSLQVAEMYCNDQSGINEMFNHLYNSKPRLTCSGVDRFGFNRPVFLDKVCDGVCDCHGCEDEGDMGACAPAGEPTPTYNCCAIINVGTSTCTRTDDHLGADAYLCDDNRNVHYDGNGKWYYAEGKIRKN